MTEVESNLTEVKKNLKGRIAETGKSITDIGGNLKGHIGKTEKNIKLTKTLVLNSAVKTVKAIDGDTKEMKEFVANMDNLLRSMELSEDCAKQPE